MENPAVSPLSKVLSDIETRLYTDSRRAPKRDRKRWPLGVDSGIMTTQSKEPVVRREIRMRLDVDDVNRRLRPLFGQYEDSFQEAWVKILERNPRTIEDLGPIVRKVRNKAIKQYLNKKHREESLHRPLGQNGDGSFTLESILGSPTDENGGGVDQDSNDGNGLYRKIVDFLIGEYLRQKDENLKLKRKEIELKAERLRLREESLAFKRDRFESWKNLMEEKGKQKEDLLRLRVQLQREKLESRKERSPGRKTGGRRRRPKQPAC
jgi:hypothetical protein